MEPTFQSRKKTNNEVERKSLHSQRLSLLFSFFCLKKKKTCKDGNNEEEYNGKGAGVKDIISTFKL